MLLSRPNSSVAASATAILCTAATLFAFLAAIRGVIMGVVPPPGPVVRAIAKALLASFYDFVFVAALTAAFLAVLWLCRTSRRAARAIVAAYFVASALTFLVALINIENVRMLGGPFTYQWLYYSDFLTSKEAQDAIAFGLSWRATLLVTALLDAMFVMPWVPLAQRSCCRKWS